MYYIVYKTSNLINGKYYIGVHKSNKLHDNYLGSGKAINRAIKKYGKENFKRENLFLLDNEHDMFQKEIELVNIDLINDKMCYNMTLGGVGSWAHIDVKGENNPMHKSKGQSWKDGKTQEEIDKINKMKGSPGSKNGMFGKTHSEQAKKRLSESNKRSYNEKFTSEVAEEMKKEISNRFKGKPKSEEQRRKMSESAKRRWENMPLLTCTYCGKMGKGSPMKRHHFENCKNKE